MWDRRFGRWGISRQPVLDDLVQEEAQGCRTVNHQALAVHTRLDPPGGAAAFEDALGHADEPGGIFRPQALGFNVDCAHFVVLFTLSKTYSRFQPDAIPSLNIRPDG